MLTAREKKGKFYRWTQEELEEAKQTARLRPVQTSIQDEWACKL